MILALLADTILFSRRVIDIQNMLLNIMTVYKQPRGVAICVCMRLNVFNVTVLRVSRGYWGTRKQRRNIVGNEEQEAVLANAGTTKPAYSFFEGGC